jgi:hypothetical protein
MDIVKHMCLSACVPLFLWKADMFFLIVALCVVGSTENLILQVTTQEQ